MLLWGNTRDTWEAEAERSPPPWGLCGHICGSRMVWCLTIGPQGTLGVKRIRGWKPRGKQGAREGPQREAVRWTAGCGESAHHGLSAVEVLWHTQLRPGGLLPLRLPVQSISCWGQRKGPQTTPQGRRSSPGRQLGAQPCLASLCNPVPTGKGLAALNVSPSSFLRAESPPPPWALSSPSGSLQLPSPGRAMRLSWACSCWFCWLTASRSP